MRSLPVLFLLCISLSFAADTARRSSPEPVVSSAQKQLFLDPGPVTAQRMVRDSALIFSGTVLKVAHLPASANRAQPLTEVTFRVQSAIRGTRPGQVIQICEWGGLWNAGERYRPGESVLLFLYPKSKLGLTSPVAGAAGRFSIDQFGHVELGAQHDFLKPRLTPRSPMSVKSLAAEIRRAAKE